MAKVTGGRPQKYPGEEPVKMTVSMRPKYKKMIEFIATQRGLTNSEAVEFCIANYSYGRKITDSQTLFDLAEMGESNTLLGMLISCFNEDWRTLSDDEISKKVKELVQERTLASHLRESNRVMIKPVERYKLAIIESVGFEDFCTYLHFSISIDYIYECWKIGINEESVIENLINLIKMHVSDIDVDLAEPIVKIKKKNTDKIA